MSGMEACNLADCAIVVEPGDNIALAKKTIPAGTILRIGVGAVRLLGEVAPGERFALVAVEMGGYLFQYGYPFARSRGIAAGELVGSENTTDEIPQPSYIPRRQAHSVNTPIRTDWSFLGYRRGNGRCGTRNYYVVVPTSMCASAVAQQIAERFSSEIPGLDGVLALPNTEGCGCAAGLQIERFLLILKNSILHDNVAGALIVDLGCEQTNYAAVRKVLADSGRSSLERPIEWLTIQHAGGTAKAVVKGIDIITANLERFAGVRRESCPLSALILASECGASDAFSGISANRVIGHAVDAVVAAGGAAIFSELPEMVGAEQVLFPRMRSPEVIEKFKRMMQWYRRMAEVLGTSMEYNLVPENRAGGLMNPYIKSLGAVMKGGTAEIRDALEYGERVTSTGLYLMQGPGNDLESVTGLAASGANIICFSTGRGTVTGCALAPVIKVSSTSQLYARMPDDIDFDAGGVLESPTPHRTLENLGEALLEKVIAVASGEKSKPEINCQRQFQIWTAGKLSL